MEEEDQENIYNLQSLEFFHLQQTFVQNLGIHGREILEGFFKKHPQLVRSTITPTVIARVNICKKH